jgi:hypothetical protein
MIMITVVIFFTVLLLLIFKRDPPYDFSDVAFLLVPFIVLVVGVLALLRFALNLEIWVTPMWVLLCASVDWRCLLGAADSGIVKARMDFRRSEDMPGYNDLYKRKFACLNAARDDSKQFKAFRRSLLVLPVPLSGAFFLVFFVVGHFLSLKSANTYESILWSLGCGFAVVDVTCLGRLYRLGHSYDKA